MKKTLLLVAIGLSLFSCKKEEYQDWSRLTINPGNITNYTHNGVEALSFKIEYLQGNSVQNTMAMGLEGGTQTSEGYFNGTSRQYKIYIYCQPTCDCYANGYDPEENLVKEGDLVEGGTVTVSL